MIGRESFKEKCIATFRFPEEIKHQTDFALTFLMMRRHEDARKILKNVLDVEPYNGIALAYYGYILKVGELLTFLQHAKDITQVNF